MRESPSQLKTIDQEKAAKYVDAIHALMPAWNNNRDESEKEERKIHLGPLYQRAKFEIEFYIYLIYVSYELCRRGTH